MVWIHRLSNVDLERKTANCSNCGEVRIKNTPRMHHPRCLNAWKANKYKSQYGDGGEGKSCEICGSTNRICFDHDHNSGKFRGWLCNSCNVALGLVRDNPETLLKMIEYLKK